MTPKKKKKKNLKWVSDNWGKDLKIKRERSKPWKQPREKQTMETNHVIVDMHQQYKQLVQS